MELVQPIEDVLLIPAAYIIQCSSTENSPVTYTSFSLVYQDAQMLIGALCTVLACISYHT